ncbi:MAG: hypothetical protein K2Y39_14930 [Candidatus Obscuribacterales bacterium]|nr:hypothetical protein [Candidatus Obscuribacterales bacterium]
MFTSANLAAARLSALENHDCFTRNAEVRSYDSVNGKTLGKGCRTKQPLDSSLVSVAALISKMDEDQPTQWESRSAPTLQLRPVRNPDQALKLFLQKVEKHRVDREEAQADTVPVLDINSSESQTVTLDRVPAFEREVRRTAYTQLMKHSNASRDFVTASDNRFNASTNILVARAEALLMVERFLRRVDNGFSVNTPAWTLTTPNTDNTPALFESCRTPQNVKVTVQDCQVYAREQQLLREAKMQKLLDQVSEEITCQSAQKTAQRTDMGVLPRLIAGILESAERLPRLNVADLPVNAMSAATTIN